MVRTVHFLATCQLFTLCLALSAQQPPLPASTGLYFRGDETLSGPTNIQEEGQVNPRDRSKRQLLSPISKAWRLWIAGESFRDGGTVPLNKKLPYLGPPPPPNAPDKGPLPRGPEEWKDFVEERSIPEEILESVRSSGEAYEAHEKFFENQGDPKRAGMFAEEKNCLFAIAHEYEEGHPYGDSYQVNLVAGRRKPDLNGQQLRALWESYVDEQDRPDFELFQSYVSAVRKACPKGAAPIPMVATEAVPL